MVGGDRVMTFVASPGEAQRSLHEFISREVNPLLDEGWSLGDVRVMNPMAEPARSGECRIEVILVGTPAPRNERS